MSEKSEVQAAVKAGRTKPFAEPAKVTVKLEPVKASGNIIKAVDPKKAGGKAKPMTEAEQAAALVQKLNPGKPDVLRCMGAAANHNTRV